MGAERCEIEFGGVRLSLLADRAVWRAALGTLYVADLHLGKPEHFRAGGSPVPEEVTDLDLRRLDRLIDATGAERVIVLGDLFHSAIAPDGETAARLARWRRDRSALDLALVRGNHDRWSHRQWAGFGIADLGERFEHDGLTLVHDPAHAGETPAALCGHVHPAVRLGGRGTASRMSLRAPCFWFSGRVGVLPAFGRFTGGKRIEPAPEDRVFVTSGEAIVEVSRSSRAGRAASA